MTRAVTNSGIKLTMSVMPMKTHNNYHIGDLLTKLHPADSPASALTMAFGSLDFKSVFYTKEQENICQSGGNLEESGCYNTFSRYRMCSSNLHV
jgi:hypothetical protein